MYERWTDRSRKVMQLANQEAQRFNHEYIGSEHILLGLVKESSGVAGNVLKNMGIDLCMVRLEVEKHLTRGPADLVCGGGKQPLTPRAKKVTEHAMTEAREIGHNYVGTEHVLLGLLRETEGIACIALTGLGVGLDVVRQEILSLLGIKTKEKAMRDKNIPKQTFRPTGDKVIVKVHKVQTSPGGVALPDSLSQKSYPEIPTGIVVAVGPDCKWVKRGDTVLIAQGQMATLCKYRGEELIAMAEQVIIGVVIEDEE